MNDYEIIIEQGSTLEIITTIRDSAGELIDISGWNFRGQLRQNYSSNDIAASFSFEILDQSIDLGKLKIFIPATETELIPVNPAKGLCPTPTSYAYDIEAETETNFVYRLLSGVVKVIPEVTR